MNYKTIDNFNLSGKTVLVRVDFNVPLTMDGEIANNKRIVAHIPTIEDLTNQGARVILVSHLGRPRRNESRFSLEKVAVNLSKSLNKPVSFINKCIGEEVKDKIRKLKDGDVLLLENIRFEDGEEFNDDDLNNQLSELAEIYLNDAFATAHRKHCSTYGVATKMEHCGIGRLMEYELKTLHNVMEAPKRPLMVIVGGAKVSTKINVLKHIISKANTLIVGGAMANTFLAALNHEMGNSMYEPDFVETAREILSDAGACGCRIILPNDITVASELLEDIKTKNIPVDEIAYTEMALDIGEESIKTWCELINNSGTVLWNGPIGAFEVKPFNKSTFKLVEALAKTEAFTVVGGGDTLHAIDQTGCSKEDFNHVCTGGGALLKFLEGDELVALEGLK